MTVIRPFWPSRAYEAIKAGLRVFSRGYPAGRDFFGESKAAPLLWPVGIRNKPQWRLQDVTAFIEEGFTRNSLVYSCIMYKVKAAIPAPLRAFTGTMEYPELLPDDHPLNVRIADPNEHQTWTEFHNLNYVYLNISGDCFIYNDPSDGTLTSLRPDWVRIVPNETRPASVKGYVYAHPQLSEKDWAVFLAKDIIHIKLPNPGDPLNGWGYGLSPMAAGAQSGDVDNMITAFLNVFFKKGAQILGLLSFDAALDPDKIKDIKKRWEDLYGGYENWSIGVLDRGGQYKRIGLTFDEMGFDGLDARNETRILGPFGVPPILVGSKVGLDRATYSNQEGAREMCWQDTIYPELILFEVEYQKYLRTDDAFVLFDVSRVPALQKPIPKLVNAAYQLCQMRATPNQAIRAMGLSRRVGYIEGGDEPIDFSSMPVAKEVRDDEQEKLRRPETEVGGVYDE